MKKLTFSLMAAAALLAGCSEEAQYIDSTGTSVVVSVDKVDIQDFKIAADGLLQSLYDSPAFTNAPRTPPILAISKVTNDTSTQFETDILLSEIRSSITRSGKAEVSAIIGYGGRAQDEMAKEAKAAGEFEAGSAPVNLRPDFTLTGKIMEVKASAGRTKQVTYAFQMTLVRVSTGSIVWEEQKLITKQGTKAAVGM